MAQGPFGNAVSSSLSAVFGGVVTLHAGTPDARTVRAIFRHDPRRVAAPGGAEVEVLVPLLRAGREVIGDLVEGAQIDPGNGFIYVFEFFEETATPGGLLTARLSEV